MFKNNLGKKPGTAFRDQRWLPCRFHNKSFENVKILPRMINWWLKMTPKMMEVFKKWPSDPKMFKKDLGRKPSDPKMFKNDLGRVQYEVVLPSPPHQEINLARSKIWKAQKIWKHNPAVKCIFWAFQKKIFLIFQLRICSYVTTVPVELGFGGSIFPSASFGNRLCAILFACGR